MPGPIFGLYPFEPKRQLILPLPPSCQGSEIKLYVLDGKAYPEILREIGEDPQHIIHCVHFNGWIPSFRNDNLVIPPKLFIENGDCGYYELEVAFRLIPSPEWGQTPEIVAVSYDGGKTFYENELCTLPSEYDKAAEPTHSTPNT